MEVTVSFSVRDCPHADLSKFYFLIGWAESECHGHWSVQWLERTGQLLVCSVAKNLCSARTGQLDKDRYQTWWDWGIALLHDWSFMPSAQAKLVFLFWKDILHNLKAQYIYGAKHAPIKIQECTLHNTLSRMHICFAREKARILELLPVLLALRASHLVCVPVDFDDRTLHPFWFLWTRQ